MSRKELLEACSQRELEDLRSHGVRIPGPVGRPPDQSWQQFELVGASKEACRQEMCRRKKGTL